MYDHMIKTENSDSRNEAWKEYREKITNYILHSIEDMYYREHLLREKKRRDGSFSMDKVIALLGRKPRVAIWGAGYCNDIDLSKLARSVELVLIDREQERVLQAASRYGLQEPGCTCVDLGFWDITEEDERLYDRMLQKDEEDAGLAQSLTNLGTSLRNVHREARMKNVFDVSVVFGLASQLNVRFAGLMKAYGKNMQEYKLVEAALQSLNEQAAQSLWEELQYTTAKGFVLGTELRTLSREEWEGKEYFCQERQEEIETLLLQGDYQQCATQCEIAGSREFLICVEESIARKDVRILQQGCIFWEFLSDKLFEMDLKSLFRPGADYNS